MTEEKKIALVGSPNSGKSSLFNLLTGLNQRVGNFPGVTVDRKSGKFTLDTQLFRVVDLPGIYSLYPRSEDEAISAQVLRNKNHPDHPDLVLLVADATNLKRSLVLGTQVIELGLPVVLALNMNDLARGKGLEIDEKSLSIELGVPVVPVSALKGEGIDELKNALVSEASVSDKVFFTIPSPFIASIGKAKKILNTSSDYLAYHGLIDTVHFDESLHEDLLTLRSEAKISEPKSLIANELLVRHDRLDNVFEQPQQEKHLSGNDFTSKLDRILIHPVWGYVIFLGILALVFQSIFEWASFPMDVIDSFFGHAGKWMESVLPESFLTSLWVDGIWAGLGGIVIFIPQIAFLFLFIAILEDSGYMSRVVFLMDRIMKPFGFSGRSVIPLMGGMACAVPSIMLARNIPNKYERLITIMVTPLMSCSARIPVFTLLIALFVPRQYVLGVFNLQGLTMLGMYLLGFVMALLVAFCFKVVLKYNSTGLFVTELPIYRMPRWNNVALVIYNKCKTFVVEAGKIIMVISVILWLMASYAPGDTFEQIEQKYAIQLAQPNLPDEEISILESEKSTEKLLASYAGIIGSWIEPAIRPLGYDWKIGISLITSFAAREVFVGTMATLYSLEEDDESFESLLEKMRKSTHPRTGEPVYTTATAISLMIFFAFAMQCMSTLAITRRETNSWFWTLVMVVYLTVLAYVSAFLAYQLLS